MHFFHSMGHVIGGTLLIAATAIGVGMLAMPVATAEAGFLPSVVVYLLCWLFMLCTGLLFLEACIWMPKDANLITMVDRLLGFKTKILCWFVYLFLFVTVMIAHVVGGGSILREIFGPEIPMWASSIFYVIIFFPVVYLGARSVDRFNFFLMAGIIVSYILFIVFSAGHTNMKLLSYSNWSKALWSLPILFTAFTYQVIVPTLMSYMNRDVKKVRLSIILGSSIPLVVYLIWEFLILGIVPVQGPHGLVEAGKLGQTAIAPLKEFTGNRYLFGVSKSFAFFTMTASYIALSLAYFDFLADGLKIKKEGVRRLWLALLVFLPPTFVALYKPTIFITALDYAGGVSCAILFGIFPPLMVWVGRYVKNYSRDTQQLPGGKPLLVLLMLFIVLELGMEVHKIFLQVISNM